MSFLYCPYCNGKARLESSTRVYGGRDYGLIYLCENYPACDAYVGVHKGTTNPLGRLANGELRNLKMQAHDVFDRLWKKKIAEGHEKWKARGSAYKWLAKKMGIDKSECHIGMFDAEKCKKVIEICSKNV